MELDLQPFSLALDEPLETARGTIDERSGLLVRVRTDERRGLGEATPLPGWTESLDRCRDALERAGDVLSWAGPEAAIAAVEDAPAARHGLSLALADLRARRLSVPLYRHLGRRSRARDVRVNATLGDAPAEETVASAVRAVEDGFQCLKVKVGARPLPDDVDRLEAIREAVGPDVELRADANGAWDRETAERAVDRVADLDLAYLEQPLPATELSGLAALRGGPVDVAVDETVATVDADRLLDRGVADVLVVKPMVVGGPDRAVELARRGRAEGVRPVVSTTVDAVVARSGAVHVAAALAPLAPCGLATAGRLAEDLGPDPAPVADGIVTVPQGPGTGIRLSAE